MSKSTNQKFKLPYLMKIFQKYTDETHWLSLQQLSAHLNEYDINVERKTLYSDIDDLRQLGVDIETARCGRTTYYYLNSREFELPELKMLVDSIQSAKFISEHKSHKLIEKLESLVSIYEAKQLHRQVVISGRAKTINKSVYYSIDTIHNAINRNSQIKFQYFQWNLQKEMELRHDGQFYQVSPWALVWSNENYYLIGFDSTGQKIKHYRIDKMLQLDITDKQREGEKAFQNFHLPKYSQGHFSMFGGQQITVTLLCNNKIVGVIIDRFGQDIPIIPVDDEHFRVHVDIFLSQQFIGWIVGLGNDIQILGPDIAVQKMKETVTWLNNQYQN